MTPEEQTSFVVALAKELAPKYAQMISTLLLGRYSLTSLQVPLVTAQMEAALYEMGFRMLQKGIEVIEEAKPRPADILQDIADLQLSPRDE